MNTILKKDANLFDELMGTILNDQKKMKTVSTLNFVQNPLYNIKENQTEFILELAVPGVNKENFNIEVIGNLLKVSSVNPGLEKGTDEVEAKYTRKEFDFQSFKKNFSLPKNVDLSKEVSAKYENGILMIKIFKLIKSQDTAKKITVE